MKTIFLFLIALICTITVHSQNVIPLIGDKAPYFEANTTNGKLVFPDDFGEDWKILFSHPRDFTPVCTSEVLQLARMQEEFKEINVKIAVISTDELDQHYRWKSSIERIEVDGIDAVNIEFPFIEDCRGDASRKYGMIHKESRNVKDVRGVFIIDHNNVIQGIIFYPMKVGRNMEEIKRAVIALQTVNPHVATPVNWEPGDDLLMSASPHLNPKLDENDIKNDYYNIGSVMWYKKGSGNVDVAISD